MKFQDWTQAITKALHGRPYRRKLPSPYQIWCKARTLQSLKVAAVKDSGRGDSIWRSPYGGKLEDHFLHLDLMLFHS